MTRTENNQDFRIGRSGWSDQEDQLLWQKVAQARKSGCPLKSVFDQVAETTGRKANSIRNYYYAQVRLKRVSGQWTKEELPDVSAFVPFTQQEVRDMLMHVLSAQAKGKSVRACTLEMGGGDNKAMLRYQNKYRSVVRNNPALVAEVMQEMQQKGIPYVDPYQPGATHRGRRRSGQYDGDLEQLGAQTAKALRGLPKGACADVFKALQALGAAMERELDSTDSGEMQALECENQRLAMQCEQLLAMLRQLIEVNRNFLARNQQEKFSLEDAGALENSLERIRSDLTALEEQGVAIG